MHRNGKIILGKLLFVSILFIGGIYAITAILSPKKIQQAIFFPVRYKAQSNEDYQIVLASQNYVKERLKSPSTAEFPNPYSVILTATNYGHYIITSYVDAQNGFGASLRENYECEIVYNGSDDILVINFQFLQ